MSGSDGYAVPLMMAGFAGGTFCTGLALSALRLNPIQINISSSSELVASLVGALVGGGISIAATVHFNRSERLRREKSAAYLLLTQASTMLTDLLNIDDYIKSCLSDHPELNPDEYWTVIVPNVGTYRQLSFNQEGMALLIGWSNFDLHSDLVRLEIIYNTTAEAWNLFVTLRRDLAKLIPVNAASGDLLQSNISIQENPEAIIRIIELRSLILSLVELIPERIAHARTTTTKIGPNFKEYFRESKFPTLTVEQIKPQP